MDSPPALRTLRLLLRPWRDEDLEPLAALAADRQVMEDLPAPLSRRECAELIARSRAHFAEHGFGLLAVELPGEAAFIGFAGLWRPNFQAPFSRCVEIGWRLAVRHWGRGFATEAATGLLHLAFGPLTLTEVVGLSVAANQRSRRVMEKLGMRLEPSVDFLHPLLPPGHPLRRQVLYRIDGRTWRARGLGLSVAALDAR